MIVALFIVSLFFIDSPIQEQNMGVSGADSWNYTQEGNAGGDDGIYDAMQERNPGEVYKFDPYPDYFVSGVPSGDYEELQIDFQVANLGAEDIYLRVWDYNGGQWNTRFTFNSSSSTPLKYNLTSDEISGGVCYIQFVDSDQTFGDTLQSTLGIDYVRVYTSSAGSSTDDNYVDDNTSNIDGAAGKGTHSNFTKQQGYDSAYDNLTETGGTVIPPIEDFIDSQSNVDSSYDIGSHSDFNNMKARDSTYDDLTEEIGARSLPVVASWDVSRGYATTCTLTLPAGTEDGDLLIIVITTDGEGSYLNGPSGWNVLLTENQSGGQTTASWYKIASSEPSSYDVTWSGDEDYVGGIVRIIGADTSNPIDVTNSGTGTGSPIAPAVTTTEDNELIIRFCGIDDDDQGDYFTTPAGHTSLYARQSPSGSGECSGSIVHINQTTLGDTGSATWPIGGDEGWYAATVAIKGISLNYYHLDIEVQFTGVIHFLSSETLCIYAGATDAENITVQYWTGSGWLNLTQDLTENSWNNVSVSLTSETFTIRFLGGSESGDLVQSSWEIDAVLLRVSEQGSNEDAVDNNTSNVDGYNDLGTLSDFNNMKTKDGMATLRESEDYNENYRLDQEVQWTNITYQVLYKQLCIYAGAFSGSEDIRVDFWNGTHWINVFSYLTPYSWNNYSISSYVNSPTFTIRFVDETQTSDSSRNSWEIDVALIYVWQEENEPFDIDLEIRWTSVDTSESYYNLSIYCGTFNTSEDLEVYIWDGFGWQLITLSLTDNSWNNFTITSYIFPNVIIRFLGALLKSDSICSAWEIDASIIFGWTPELNEYDYTTEGNATADDDSYDEFNESGTGTMPTALNAYETSLTKEIGETAVFSLTFININGSGITGANLTYVWEYGSGQLVEVGDGVYELTIKTSSLDEGTYYINVTAFLEDYEVQSLQLSLVIKAAFIDQLLDYLPYLILLAIGGFASIITMRSYSARKQELLDREMIRRIMVVRKSFALYDQIPSEVIAEGDFVDKELVSGFFTAIKNITEEVAGVTLEAMKVYPNHPYYFVDTGTFYCVLILSDKPSRRLEEKLVYFAEVVKEKYGNIYSSDTFGVIEMRLNLDEEVIRIFGITPMAILQDIVTVSLSYDAIEQIRVGDDVKAVLMAGHALTDQLGRFPLEELIRSASEALGDTRMAHSAVLEALELGLVAVLERKSIPEEAPIEMEIRPEPEIVEKVEEEKEEKTSKNDKNDEKRKGKKGEEELFERIYETSLSLEEIDSKKLDDDVRKALKYTRSYFDQIGLGIKGKNILEYLKKEFLDDEKKAMKAFKKALKTGYLHETPE